MMGSLLGKGLRPLCSRKKLEGTLQGHDLVCEAYTDDQTFLSSPEEIRTVRIYVDDGKYELETSFHNVDEGVAAFLDTTSPYDSRVNMLRKEFETVHNTLDDSLDALSRSLDQFYA